MKRATLEGTLPAALWVSASPPTSTHLTDGGRRATSRIDGTAATLAPFTGEDGGPIYIALRRKVYDVSTGADFYGPGNGYSKFAGKDASRAMAKMSFDPADVDERGCEELTEVQVKTLDDWIAKVRARVLCCVFLCFPSALLLADPVACHRAPSHLHAAVRQQVSDSRLGG